MCGCLIRLLPAAALELLLLCPILSLLLPLHGAELLEVHVDA